MKKNKLEYRSKSRRLRILLTCLLFTFLLLKSNNKIIAQGDPYEYNEGYLDAYEEVDLYIDSYSKRKQTYTEDAPYSSGGGYLGVGIGSSGSLDTRPPQEINGPPTTPTYPDVPVNGFVSYLMIIGLFYTTYQIFRSKTN